MSLVWRVPAWLSRSVSAAASVSIMASVSFGQSATPSVPAAGAAPAPASCVQLADSAVPLNATIQAKVTGTIQASRLKPGKDIWVTSVYGMAFPGCSFEPNASIYGKILAASASKDPSASEIAIQFDRIDCAKHDKQPMKLYLIGIIGPSDRSGGPHDAMPNAVNGGGRQVDNAGTTDADNGKLKPGAAPNSIKPGDVLGIKNLTLEPQGGPACSARLSSTSRNIELPPDTKLVLAPLGSQK